jgi:tripartite-type tricarboxylate transporter receptor subunit TctC
MEFFSARFCTGIFACAAIFALPASGAVAQTVSPDSTVRIIVTNPPGGIVDIVARVMAQQFTKTLGRNFIVDNRAGASGTIATALVARAAPNGLTLLMAPPTSIVVAPSMFKSLPYDPLKDLTPISEIAYAPLILVVKPTLDVHSVKDLIALAKAKPGALAFGSGGYGSAPHITGELFAATAGVKLTHVPYKGEAPSITDLLTGQLQLDFSNVPAVSAFIKAGQLRALGVTSLKRMASMPDLPTISESGLPGFDAITWVGLFAPKNAPQNVVAPLNAAVVHILADAAVQKQFAEYGLTLVGNASKEFAADIATEIPKWKKVMNDAGVPLQ